MYIEIVHMYCVFVQVCAVLCNHPVVSCLDLCMTWAVDTASIQGTCNSTITTVTLLLVPNKSFQDSNAISSGNK